MEEESILSSFLMEHMDTHVSVGPYASINCSKFFVLISPNFSPPVTKIFNST